MKIATIELDLNEDIDIDWKVVLKELLEASDNIYEATVISLK